CPGPGLSAVEPRAGRGAALPGRPASLPDQHGRTGGAVLPGRLEVPPEPPGRRFAGRLASAPDALPGEHLAVEAVVHRTTVTERRGELEDLCAGRRGAALSGESGRTPAPAPRCSHHGR